MGLDDPWDDLRTMYAEQGPGVPRRARCPGSTRDGSASSRTTSRTPPRPGSRCAAPRRAACWSATAAARRTSHLAGRYAGRQLEVLAAQALPHSLGLLYEELTEHLGFLRSSDEYKVMALASYGEPRLPRELRELIRADRRRRLPHRADRLGRARARAGGGRGAGPARTPTSPPACSARLEEVLLDLARWLHEQTGDRVLTMAGGVALNCVANTRLAAEGPFDEVWVQPAAGDAGTALGARAARWPPTRASRRAPMPGADLGRGWSDDELEAALRTRAACRTSGPPTSPTAVADVLADDGIVAWFQGRSEFGPRALGHRSLLAHPGQRGEPGAAQRRQGPRAVPAGRADGAGRAGRRDLLPRPAAQPVHAVRPRRRRRSGGTASRPSSTSTAPPGSRPSTRRRSRWSPRCSTAFERRTGLPVVVNTSLNTAGRPMVDDPATRWSASARRRSTLLAIGPFLVRTR